MKTKLKMVCRVFFGVIIFSIIPCSFVLADESIATSTTIYLDIESATSTLFSDAITVSACPVDASSAPTISGYCAVRQSGLASDWSLYGEDQFLNSLGGIANDYGNDLYWSWFSNLNYGQTSLNQHVLTPNENLLVTIGRMPLKLNISTTTPYVGDVLKLDVLSFGFDTSWRGLWSRATSSNIRVENNSYPADLTGHYEMSVSTTTSFVIYASADNFLNSNYLTVSPQEWLGTTTATTIASTTDQLGDIPNYEDDGSGSPNNQKEFDISKAVDFLLSKQQADGTFGASLYTDWIAIALASNGEEPGRNKIRASLESSADHLVTATDYERHAMALMSLNINPYTGTAINYIEKIVEQFDGIQLGDSSLINDDIFAFFPLINSGYYTSDLIIQKLIENIILQQETNGSWEGGVDLTAAAIQALSLVSSYEGVENSLNMARDYLSSQQQADGGFGGSFSTSWSLQAISALGESNSGWRMGDSTPEDFLSNLQQIDGGMELIGTGEDTRLWATAYAIPAILHKPWSEILSTFPKQDVLSGESNIDIESDLAETEDLENQAPIEEIVLVEPSLVQSNISVIFPSFSTSSIEGGTNILLDKKSLKEIPLRDQNDNQIQEKESNILPLATVGVNHPKISFYIVIVALFLSGIICTVYFLKLIKKRHNF